MAAKPWILDPNEIDTSRVVADLSEIRRYNQQRFEMEQLTAICLEDGERYLCAGYKDLGPDEFWVRGHMPTIAVMPGVVMCEAAAQMCSYFASKYKLMSDCTVGLGGLDEIRFRDVVRPGDRLVIVARLLKCRPNLLVVCEFQEFVSGNLVCEGEIRGVALPADAVPPSSLAR